MTILESDIILLASQVMDDVPEGGGAATGNVIVDGVSNNMFPDISELDHTLGRVQLRKVFLGINTPTVDTYLGANFIVMKPPPRGSRRTSPPAPCTRASCSATTSRASRR